MDRAKPKFPRHPIEIPSRTAERGLFAALESIAEEYAGAEDFGRVAAKESVEFCIGFLHSRGLSGQAMKALRDILHAFEDVEKGILPELFDPKARERAGAAGTRRKPRSSAAQQIKITAAACMSALMAGGMRKREAASNVARHAQRWPRYSGGAIEPITITNWRDELMQQPSQSMRRRLFEHDVKTFTDTARGPKFLEEVLKHGPFLTGGTRAKKT